jgi:ATPase family protein associated with various cellular activities (AAA)
MSGLNLYIGAPGTGKTFAALLDADALNRPVFIVDSSGVVDAEHGTDCGAAVLCRSRSEAWVRYGGGESVRYIPKDENDLNALFAGLNAAGSAAVVLDEIVHWTTGQYCPPDLLLSARLQRHYHLDLFFTTQQPQDVPSKIRNCATSVKVFKCSDQRALQACEQWAPPDIVQNLERGAPHYPYVFWGIDSPAPVVVKQPA